MQNTSESSRIRDSSRELLIDVQLPEVTYAFAVSLSIDDQSSTLICGEPQAATLRLSYTTIWARQHLLNREFVYELDMPPDTWLVNGSRVTRFKAEEGEEIVQSIGLLPLKAGICAYPQVHVRVASPVDEVIVQTELKSQYQTVTVVDGIKSVTVALGAEGQLSELTKVVHAAT